jgi:nucleotide-binding universal stress UspA family protein
LTSAHEPDPAGPSPHGYQSILCAVELNPEADVVLDAAVRFAHAYRAKMCLLHIEPVFHLHDRRLSAEAIRCAFEHTLRTAEQEFDVDIRVRVLDAGVSEGVRRAASEEKADLVVVGRGHQQGNFSRMWSHLYTIIREAPCPVLSV